MLLSRFWYVFLGLVVAMTLYVTYLAVGQYNRRNAQAATEMLASDSQVVGWALQIDARRRLDALLIGSVDKGVQDALIAANGKDRVPSKARDDARKALIGVAEKIPADFRNDALFAVDRDGRVVGQTGFDAANGYDDFELGGYGAVNDALHGYLRDDTWVLGGKMYRVVARPVEFDVTQPPAGAIVGIKMIDLKFAQEVSRRTRTNVAFYAGGQRVASDGVEGFDPSQFDSITGGLAQLDSDKTYKEAGRSDAKLIGDHLGVIYARILGETWDLGAGFAVLRPRVEIAGPLGFLSDADDKDKAHAPIVLVGLAALIAMVVGIGLSIMEHTLPLRTFKRHVNDFQTGVSDTLLASKMRGTYRAIATSINAGLDRLAETGGGVPRKAADLEQILGPTAAQPSMSAFSLPQSDDGRGASGNYASSLADNGGPRRPVPPLGYPSPNRMGMSENTAPGIAPPLPPLHPPSPSNSGPMSSPISGPLSSGSAPRISLVEDDDDEPEGEATMVAAVPAAVLAQAIGEASVRGEKAEWPIVYDEFIRVKKQCGESIDGFTFERFAQTLKKNRDVLVQKHGCNRVKFSVYVKDGRASLKATPVKD